MILNLLPPSTFPNDMTAGSFVRSDSLEIIVCIEFIICAVMTIGSTDNHGVHHELEFQLL